MEFSEIFDWSFRLLIDLFWLLISESRPAGRQCSCYSLSEIVGECMVAFRVAKNIENTTLGLAWNFDYFRGSASFQPRQFLITLASYQPQGLHQPFTWGKPWKLRDFKAKPQNTLNQKLVTNPQTRTQIFRGSPNFSKCSIQQWLHSNGAQGASAPSIFRMSHNSLYKMMGFIDSN